MDFLLETAISAFFLAGILAIAFLFFWRARAVERQIGLLMRAALTNTKDIRHCTDAIHGGFQQLGKADNHHRALLASLNSQISNLGSMLEAGYARPEGKVGFAPDEAGKAADPADRTRSHSTDQPVAKQRHEENSEIETADSLPVAHIASIGGRPVAASSPTDLAKPFEIFGSKDAFGSFGSGDGGLPGFRSVRNRSSDKFVTTGDYDAGHQRKMRTIDELFRKIELPRTRAGDMDRAAAPSNVSPLRPSTPPSFADLVSQRRRVANG